MTIAVLQNCKTDFRRIKKEKNECAVRSSPLREALRAKRSLEGIWKKSDFGVVSFQLDSFNIVHGYGRPALTSFEKDVSIFVGKTQGRVSSNDGRVAAFAAVQQSRASLFAGLKDDLVVAAPAFDNRVLHVLKADFVVAAPAF